MSQPNGHVLGLDGGGGSAPKPGLAHLCDAKTGQPLDQLRLRQPWLAQIFTCVPISTTRPAGMWK